MVLVGFGLEMLSWINKVRRRSEELGFVDSSVVCQEHIPTVYKHSSIKHALANNMIRDRTPPL